MGQIELNRVHLAMCKQTSECLCKTELFEIELFYILEWLMVHSVGDIEYTNCFSAGGYPANECP